MVLFPEEYVEPTRKKGKKAKAANEPKKTFVLSKRKRSEDELEALSVVDVILAHFELTRLSLIPYLHGTNDYLDPGEVIAPGTIDFRS